jgi:hypothetical protein
LLQIAAARSSASYLGLGSGSTLLIVMQGRPGKPAEFVASFAAD